MLVLSARVLVSSAMLCGPRSGIGGGRHDWVSAYWCLDVAAVIPAGDLEAADVSFEDFRDAFADATAIFCCASWAGVE